MYSEPRATGAQGACRTGGQEMCLVVKLAKKGQGQIVKEEIGRITVHSTPFVLSRSGRRTGQVSWGLRSLVLSLGCRSAGSHV